MSMSEAQRAPIARHRTRTARVGEVAIGGGNPIVVQSMTNTDTADVAATVTQVEALAAAGSELVRITVNSEEAAAAVARHTGAPRSDGCSVPLIGDFHFNGHKLLTEYPDCAQALAKYRINPGNVGKGSKHDDQFAQMIELALQVRQAGAHRRQLGQPRPGAAGAADGRKCPAAEPWDAAQSCARRWSFRRSTARSAPRSWACRASGSSCRAR